MLKYPISKQFLLLLTFWWLAIVAQGQQGALNQSKYAGKRFYRDIQFTNTRFYEASNFSKARFHGQVSFINCYIKKTLDFSGATFRKTVDLSGTTFRMGADFTQARLPRTLILRDLNLKDCKGTIDLSKVRPGGRHAINLLGTDISKVKLNYAYFKLSFAGFEGTTDALLNAKKQVYTDLLRQQKVLGFHQGYQKLSKEFARRFPKAYDSLGGLKAYDSFVVNEMGSSEEQGINSLMENEKMKEEMMETIRKFQKVEEKRLRKAKNAKALNEAENIFAVVLIVGLLLFAFPFLSKRPKAQPSSVQKTPYQTPVATSKPSYVKQKRVPPRKAQDMVTKGNTLWRTYQPPKNVLKESEKFWQAYEQLLKKGRQKV